MGFKIPNGGSVAIASTYATQATLTALTNASEGVATLSASHGIIVGDIFEVSSGWQRLDKRVVRAKTVATNDVTLEGINTGSTSLYPAAGGAGTIREITAWTDISQIRELAVSGGDQQFADITVLADVLQKQIPTVRAPLNVQITFAYDAALAWLATVRTASEAQALTAIRFSFPDGSKIYGNGYWSLQEMPNIAQNEVMTARIDMSFVSTPTSYSS
jgi:hypothetical protein